MLTDIIAGAGGALLFLSIGYGAGRRDKKNRKPPGEICRCGHGPERHDGKGCHAVVDRKPVEWYSGTEDMPTAWEEFTCTCVRYVGPNTSYVPELEG